MKRLFIFAASSLATAFAAPVPYDVVVYGGTSGGVAAAVQVARSGKSVVLISPTSHLGGMTTSGLGWTDLGKSSILGGISREFYQRLYQHYQHDEAWNWQSRESYGNNGQGGPAFNHTTQVASVFEPKVAESIFGDLITEQGVPVITGRLEFAGGVVMVDEKISHLRLEDGREFGGKIFIDASYEGDLMLGAGVSFTVGREANAVYNESVSGIQVSNATKNQLRDGIDPYVVAGDAGSGLLPGVNPDAGGPDGSGDEKLQAYCYRMVLTDVAENRIMIGQPDSYDEADYELLFRAIEAGQTGGFFKLDLMPNRKTDSNNTGGISTDYIGKNYGDGWNWATLDHDQRAALAKEHENWQRGLVWTLQNHPRVPVAIREAYAKWGLPADEFMDNNHWPYQLYVREARRMVSDYVMSQQHCSGTVVAPDSIGLAAYTMDSHHVQRHVRDGMVKNEGDVQFPVPDAYPVSYKSIVPKKGECTNLLVPWSLSASHMAFGSIRMEPVFMILSQSAAIAANLAIDQEVDVQDVAYAALRPALVEAGQQLGDPAAVAPTSFIDNDDPLLVTVTGDWLLANSTAGYAGIDYLHDNNEAQGGKKVSYRFPAETQGVRRVYLRWTAHENRASNVSVEIRHRDGTALLTVDQRTNGAKWNAVGLYHFSGDPEEGLTIRTHDANGYVVADAVGLSEVAPDEDTDGDGLSDVRELLLGLDPFTSDEPLIAGLQGHPELLGLHGSQEIYDLVISQADQLAFGPAELELTFDILDYSEVAGWSNLETINRFFPIEDSRKFFRVALQAEPTSLVQGLADGASRTIVVYGTSLTANGAWIPRLEQWLAEKYPGQVTLINSGLSGKNSAEGLAQLAQKVLSHAPDVVFLEFAMNDAFLYSDGTPQLTVPQARNNLVTMIEAMESQNPEVEIILQTMNSVWDSPAGSNSSATLRPKLDDYYQVVRDVAEERELLLIDHHRRWAALQQDEPSVFQSYIPDGVHPVASGIEMIMEPLLQWKLSGGRPLP